MTDAASRPAAPARETCITSMGNGRCLGVRLEDADHCLAHISASARGAFLKRLKDGNPINFTRGVRFTRELLDELFAAAPVNEKKRRVLHDVDFSGAHFAGTAQFNEVSFEGAARFSGARFEGMADFGGTSFEGVAVFSTAHFQKKAWFAWATFLSDAVFVAANFAEDAAFHMVGLVGGADFRRVRFAHAAGFAEANFNAATFEEASFIRVADFERASFAGSTQFCRASFEAEANFTRARFEAAADFKSATFRGSTWFGPLRAAETLVLAQTAFLRPARFDVTAATVLGTELRLEGAGGTIGLSDPAGWVLLDGAVVGGPLTLTTVEDFTDSGAREVQARLSNRHRRNSNHKARPRVLGLRGVDASKLILADLDLGICQIAGTHFLEQLHIQGTTSFADSPHGWQVIRRWPPIWRWSRRQVLAEERAWRHATSRGAWQLGWLPAEDQGLALLKIYTGQGPRVPSAERIAGLYRALRKAQEDAKNEPGAADFYYGEMEMRRRAEATPWAERAILGLYWLISGYGLRGLRALASLIAVVVGLSALLQAIGFNDGDPSFRDVLIYAAQSTVSIPSGNEALTEHVSWAGEVLRIVLRLAGPVLLGLALLSVRNRVKR